jgi:predicted porin
VGLGWTGAGFTVGGLYEWEDNVLGADGAEGERWQIQAGYTFGNNMIKAMYGQGNFDVSQRLVEGGVPAGVAPFVGAYDEESDQSAWAVGLDHNFSKRTKAYILYTAVSGDSKSSATLADDVGPFYGVAQKRDYDAGGFSIGMIHTF